MTVKAVKQVIVMRRDLNMRKGKMVAQGAHASMGALLKLATYDPGDAPNKGKLIIDLDAAASLWLRGSFVKICVGVDSEAELLGIRDKCDILGLTSCLITDNGTTEFNGVPTITCLGIGPDFADQIDLATWHLKLL